MIGKVGDRIIIESTQVGQPPREGEILEVTDTPSGPHYRVRWDDGHETIFMPAGGSTRVFESRRQRSA